MRFAMDFSGLALTPRRSAVTPEASYSLVCYPNCFSERSALSGAFLHCFILFVFCFYICIAFLLIFVPLKEYYSASTPPLPQRQFPKFQFSKKTKETKKTNCARTLPHPLFPPWSVQNCFFCFFGILENWNFGFFDFLEYFKIFNFLGSRQYSHFLSIPEQSLKSNDKNPQ